MANQRICHCRHAADHGVGSVYLTYAGTRESYRAVGVNDGSIAEREETIAHIAKSLYVVDCHSLPLPTGAVTPVCVKTESMVAIPAARAGYTFCQYSRRSQLSDSRLPVTHG